MSRAKQDVASIVQVNRNDHELIMSVVAEDAAVGYLSLYDALEHLILQEQPQIPRGTPLPEIIGFLRGIKGSGRPRFEAHMAPGGMQ